MKNLYTNRKKHLFFTLPVLALLFLLAACGSNAPAHTNQGVVPTSTTTSTTSSHGNSNSQPQSGNGKPQQSTNPSTAQPTTVAMPVTQTTCPAPGTARALVTEPLALGNHQNLVYIVNGVQNNVPTYATLKRYDVATGTKTVIVQLSNTTIDSAQISADGQWVLFVSGVAGLQQKLQAVRLDGQGLQTLYCSSSLKASPQWSVDQRLIAFDAGDDDGALSIYLLHTSDGTLEKVFSQQNPGPYAYLLRTWLDNSHLYLSRATTDRSFDLLAVLDIRKGDNQGLSDLKQIIGSNFGGFDSSYDATQLFVNHNMCGYGCTGPSTITVQPAMGGKEQTIYSSTQYAVTQVRAVTAHTLLFAIDNQTFGSSSVDQSHNGLYTINTDGSNLNRLFPADPGKLTYLNSSSQFPWSNLSRDGTTYAALQVSRPSTYVFDYTIILGSLNGGNPVSIASIGDGPTLDIAGWTLM